MCARVVVCLVSLLVSTSAGIAPDRLSFILLGDWGWEGSFNASAVAYQMGVYGWRVNAQFVLALGDNFYVDGVANTTDRLWNTAFHDVYTASSLQIPWYAILGNHDYHGSIQAQIDRSVLSGETIWKMPAKYYALKETLPNGDILSIIMVDTAILEPGHDDTTVIYDDPNWAQHTADHLKWIDETLEEHSKVATWVIVCGHYPIYSVGVNGDNSVLLSNLYPILQFHKVHMYVSGHDHNHQFIRMPDGITHVIAGNGAGRGPFGPEGYKFLGISASTKYIENYFTDSGFAYVEADEDSLSTTFVDAKGGVHYTGVLKNPHDSYYRAMMSGVTHNYHLHIESKKASFSDDAFLDFAMILLPGLAVLALLTLYVFRDKPSVAAFLKEFKAMKNEAVVEISSLSASKRMEMDASTRSDVGLTADMDRSGRRDNFVDKSAHV